MKRMSEIYSRVLFKLHKIIQFFFAIFISHSFIKTISASNRIHSTQNIFELTPTFFIHLRYLMPRWKLGGFGDNRRVLSCTEIGSTL